MRMIFCFDRLHHRRYLFADTGFLQVFDLSHMVSSIVLVLIDRAWDVVDLVIDSDRCLFEALVVTEFRRGWAT